MKNIIFIILLHTVHISYGQTGEKEYMEALKSYETGQFEKSLQQLNKVELLLGETNAVIEQLRVKCYFDLEKYTESRNALNEFYKHPSSVQIANEMKKYEKKIQSTIIAEPLKAVNEQHREINKLFDSRISYINSIIDEKDLEIKQFIKNGTAQFIEAMDSRSIIMLEQFLVHYPNSIHVDSVRSELIPLLEEKIQKDVDTTAIIKETQAYYPGGTSAYRSFIIKNFEYPKTAITNNIQGKVFIEIIIDIDGSVTEPKVIRGIGGGCDEVALNIIKKMPNWIPATQNGKTVKTRLVLPISFVLH